MPDNSLTDKQSTMLKWLWLSGLIIVLDQITKVLASNLLQMHQPVPVMPMFNMTLMHNTGAAFSFLSDAGGWQRWFFTVIAVVVSTVIFFWIKKLDRTEKLQAIALAMVLGGAIGNVIDRILFGYVIDFIQWYYDQWYWPAFNIADSAITVGVTLLIIDSLRATRKISTKQD
ncbi:MAG: signal peptidase II [Gammaproteobacteria bacterium]|nr:signal peptidase II [Gammaproteobacteria bacterium]